MRRQVRQGLSAWAIRRIWGDPLTARAASQGQRSDYSRSPAASRASTPSVNQCRRRIFPSRTVATNH